MARQTDPFAEHEPTEAQRAALDAWKSQMQAATIALQEFAPHCPQRVFALKAIEEAFWWGGRAINQTEE